MQSLHLESLPLQAYQTMDMAIFIKNIKSQYLWANHFFIRKSAGHQSINDIYQKQDHDFAWHDYANTLQSNDLLLFENRQSLSVRERILRHDGTQVEIVSKKCPLFDDKNKIIGLIGFSMELPISPITRILSKREYAAIVLLSQGNTDKQIAKKWGLSPRTIESYILNAKRKMGVASRAEIIAKLCYQSP